MWVGEALARFAAVKASDQASLRPHVNDEDCAPQQIVENIQLEVPITRDSWAIIGRRLSLIDRETCRIHYDGIIGWA